MCAAVEVACYSVTDLVSPLALLFGVSSSVLATTDLHTKTPTDGSSAQGPDARYCRGRKRGRETEKDGEGENEREIRRV